ncbi:MULTISPECIES: peptidylprolyl isomerase [unclassified Siphonobacter]|uniref:FKBP-type peptidyl-prolyl cis-trans isomerase n=1 Tax=unclassified Siphonobacter TaxID=2635712 RepID=UPI000CC566F7|nr:MULTISPECIES: peptidylprolyl isomerase [unclassified Siphonobacter]MDQ1087950.1 peptidylprolyl isomerase [Siphonobacter sp. SORGH_AS_1065]MDR6194096.1 peptidylprolyl isomerase [Siphonobacter sp. SORGH_AS_0500]PKK36909.1 peptidylprolyl isomerase [Siphonobacter sp. SORGH_AS_0500]
MAAQSGDKVRVHYTGKLTSGVVFDSSEGRDPLEFTLGSGMVIAGFDSGITGMQVGEKKTVHIPVAEAYGPSDDNLVFEFNRSDLPKDIPFEVGMQLNMHADGEGQVVPVTVTSVADDKISVDANHPLAGQDLVFEIELVGIN